MADWPIANDAAQYERSSLASASDYGVTVTSNASANTKGAWAELHAALPFEVQGVYLQVTANSTASDYAIDLGIGAGGSEQVIIANWMVSAVRRMGQSIFWPIHIAKGTRVAARMQSGATASPTLQVNGLFMSAGWGHTPGFSFCETYNFNAANTSVTTGNYDPGGTANTKASYITIGTTTRHIRALNMMFDPRNAAATSAIWRCDIAIGATPDIIFPDLTLINETTMDELGQRAFGPFPVNIPPGTAIKFRAQCTITDATDRIMRHIHMYGMG